MPYILENKSHSGCLFCRLLEASQDPTYILRKGKSVFLILNTYPYTAGHIMAIPYRHAASLGSLGPEELEELLSFAARGEKALIRAYGCSLIHGGINVGRCAGAGVEGHVHIHLVPRRDGDLERSYQNSHRQTPVEALETTYSRLDEALKQDGWPSS
ncbi:MAG: HIT domain-containing protein [Candidatus Eisenbacteria bacterium]|uniref:HIT domain-containing protein n=1 Tax=Eiseniibacteriota bacterium TaxID=2212470 RepID=A0A948RT93_UNCEI|nr:HIT domain-containing protein [Candidatus Eisenbacteria bacterium]MBU1948750.1 HIT domain-containing protein [Candidatus Eisenbacteria bacterium]MBU2690465.1 HIT domain-containing protein [Candidatus Eisenbacteria bacterium]